MVIIIVLVVLGLIFAYAAFRLSGDLSQREEEDENANDTLELLTAIEQRDAEIRIDERKQCFDKAAAFFNLPNDSKMYADLKGYIMVESEEEEDGETDN